MRVCIIGPVAPFRSGIARHTTALARELASRPDVDVSIISFSRQYPAILFPGESEIDMEVSPPERIETHFCLDSINPVSWRRATTRVLRSSPDLAMIPAWTFFVAPCLGAIACALRRRGVPVLMIVHNAADHEGAWWKNAILRFQLRQATRFLTHNARLASDLLRLVGDRPVAICAHPVFDDYPEPRYELPRVAALELLFFGLVRPYKGLDIALRALAASGLQDVRLTIVGEFWQGQEETAALIERLGLRDKIALVPRYVSDREAAEYFERCDAVIAPYRSVTGSGIVGLALRYRRPTIASNLPGLAEVICDGSTGWLFSVGDIAALAGLLATRVSRDAAAAMHTALEMKRTANGWDQFADAALDTLKSLPTPGCGAP